MEQANSKDCMKLSFSDSANNFTHISKKQAKHNVEYNIDLNKFNIDKRAYANNVYQHGMYYLIGKRESGKTFLIKDLILQLRKNFILPQNNDNVNDGEKKPLYNIIIVNCTPDMYKDFVRPVAHVITNLTNDFFRNVLELQSSENSYPLLIVLDDVMSMSKKYSNDFYEFFLNSRHYKITTILSSQFPLKFTPEIRTNFDHIFMLRDDIISNHKKLYEYYAGVIPKFNTFTKMFNDITSNYSCMVINRHGEDFFDIVEYYKGNNYLDEPLLPMRLLNICDSNFGIVKALAQNSDDDFDKKFESAQDIMSANSKIMNKNVNVYDKENIDTDKIIKKIFENNKKIKQITKENDKLYKLYKKNCILKKDFDKKPEELEELENFDELDELEELDELNK